MILLERKRPFLLETELVIFPRLFSQAPERCPLLFLSLPQNGVQVKWLCYRLLIWGKMSPELSQPLRPRKNGRRARSTKLYQKARPKHMCTLCKCGTMMMMRLGTTAIIVMGKRASPALGLRA